jgi:signal transduction histidine kinase
VAFGAIVVTLLWVAIAWDVHRERERALAAAGADTANLARAFEEHILRTVVGLDQTLLFVKAQYERDPARFDFARSVAASAILRQVSSQIGMIGADGILMQTTVDGAVPLDLSDREHFRVHRDDSGIGLFISKPIFGRVTKRWSIQLTRRLDRADGGFDGVLVLSLDAGYLGDFYDSIDVGRGGVVLLAGRDGIIRASATQSSEALGQKIVAGELAETMAVADGVGTTTVTGPLDDVRRIVSHRSPAAVPLVVVVGRAEADILAQVESTTVNYTLVGLTLSTVVAAAVLLLFRLVRQQDETARHLREKKQELFDSRERLRSYVADLERIAEMAAHDLQEPLRRVVAYAQLLATHSSDTGLDDEAKGFLSHMVEGAHRMRALVRELEDFVSVEHLPLSSCQVSSAEVLGAACERLSEVLRNTDAVILTDPLPEVVADKRFLVEVFTLLIDNAVRFRAQDRLPEIRISATATGNGGIVFSVRDNGVGIDSREAGRMFEIWHRPYRLTEGGGTGMGLALARRLIERLGGRIWVESELGEGSVFRFLLPGQTGAHVTPDLGQEAKAAA